jgi:predicted transcriptional regulator
MNLTELIINDIDPVEVGQNINVVQRMLQNLTYSHLPVSLKEEFIGCISGNDAQCFDSEDTIEDCKYAIEYFFVNDSTNWLDVLEAFAQNNTNIMPVMHNNKYVGYYELKDIISLFDQTPFFYEPGAVLIVSKDLKAYSFSEISQIIESNNAKILGVFLSKIDGDHAEITIKISNYRLSDIIQTFIRYGYVVIAGHEEDSYVQDLKDRSDYLKKYLDI